MSKGLGKKIVVKFTEDLNEVLADILVVGESYSPEGTVSQSSYYSSDYGNKAFDGSTSSRWQTRNSGTQWVQIKLDNPSDTIGFRMFSNWSQPQGFYVEGSNDGINWDTLITDEFARVGTWQQFTWDLCNYEYYKFFITSRYVSYLAIYELELLSGASTSGEESAFTISIQEETFYGSGEYVTKYPVVTKVESHPTLDSKHLLLTIKDYPTVKNADGIVTVSYDQTKGTLAGVDGLVASFNETFTPTDLQKAINPNPQEIITLGIDADVTLKSVIYKEAFSQEIITLGISATVTRTEIEEENP